MLVTTNQDDATIPSRFARWHASSIDPYEPASTPGCPTPLEVPCFQLILLVVGMTHFLTRTTRYDGRFRYMSGSGSRPVSRRFGYDCHVGISLEVHEMEIQFWETVTHDEFAQPVTPAGIYARLMRRLIQRSGRGVAPEGMPTRFANIETECERRGRFGKIKGRSSSRIRRSVQSQL
jgi:hypothetical protein